MSLSAQRDDPKDEVEVIDLPNDDGARDPRTGSGSPFGTHYSTVAYNQMIEQQERELRNLRPQFERAAHKNRKSRYTRPEGRLQLKFYNYTTQDARTFASAVEYQITSLNRDFTIDEKTYSYLILDPESKGGPQQIFNFNSLEHDYEPIQESWKGWDSFGAEVQGSSDEVSVIVVSDLPEHLGHGYARYSWMISEGGGDIIIRAEDFGTGSGAFTEGKVLTHLLANHLGLLPLIGEDACMDDKVEDTPVHDVATFYCFEDPDRRLTSTCDFKPKMINNFMSHSPDACRNEFTLGQWKRMLSAFQFITQNQ